MKNTLINLIAPFIRWRYYEKEFVVLRRVDGKLIRVQNFYCREFKGLKQYLVMLPTDGGRSLNWRKIKDNMHFFE